MAFDISVRPVTQPAPIVTTRPAAEAQQSVPTQLPESQTVVAAQNAGSSRNDYRDQREQRQFVYDRNAAEFIYQVLDSTTADVVHQVPDEASVRLRTYFREMDRAKSDHPRQRIERIA